MTNQDQTNKQAGLVITRTFDSPLETVFSAFSDGEALAQWWGPAGSKVTVKSFEFRKDGKFHYKMESDAQTMWGIFRYVEIREPDMIQFISSFSDENGGICTSPFPMDFPLEIFNEITFTEAHGKTTIRLSGHPLNATKAQEDTYHSIMDGMEKGFGNTFDQLATYLSKLS